MKQLKENMKIRQMTSPLLVRGVEDKPIKTSDFVLTNLYITGKSVDAVDESITAVVTAEVHLVDDSKACMLIDVNFLKPQKMALNSARKRLL